MGGIKKIITKLNLLIASVILTIFYITIFPLGKIIFLINTFFEKKNTKTCWQTSDKQKLDLNSPY